MGNHQIVVLGPPSEVLKVICIFVTFATNFNMTYYKLIFMNLIFIVFACFFLLRLISLGISIKNEKRLIREGAVQHGRKVSLLLTLVHIAYYFSALYEAYSGEISFNVYSYWGVGIMFFAYVMLFYVIYKLRDVWTVKIYIAPNHRIDRSFLFRTIKHPNYFLNIVPELIGVAFLCNAWYTLLIGFPIYVVCLGVRIAQEERVMSEI